MKPSHLLVSTCLALGALACGGDEAPAPMMLEPTLTNVETEVFQKSCSNFQGCHRGVSPAGGLNLEGRTYDRLFRDGQGNPNRKLVVPTNPEASYIMDRLLARGATVMPPGSPLEASRIELVRAWIAAGAMND